MANVLIVSKQMERYLSTEEIKTVCFDLKIDYEALPGSGKTALVRELCTYCEKRQRVPDLLTILQKKRPDVAWGETDNAAAATKPPVSSHVVTSAQGGQTVLDARPVWRMLHKHFSLDELHSLCIEMGISPDKLRGEAVPEKSREMALYFQRRRQLPQLVQAAANLRPDLPWGEVMPGVVLPDLPSQRMAYTMTAIHDLLQAVFSDDTELKTFCRLYFPDALSNFGSGMSFRAQLVEFLSFCERRQAFPQLLTLLQEMYPDYYVMHAPYESEGGNR